VGNAPFDPLRGQFAVVGNNPRVPLERCVAA
jgi:hypothetical protein